jgi:ribonucleoside-diphosphate reductase alpha chain
MSWLTISDNATHPSWMNEEALHTLSSGYLLTGETPLDMMKRLASTAARINNDPVLESELLHCLWQGWIGAASPVASNFGTNRGQPISCFSVHASDSVSSLYSHLKEVAQLSKNGGGVGNYFGDVRPAGAPITGGGKSTGVVPWMQQYDLCARVVSQGGVRRGSFAFYLPIDHPDVPELLRAKDHTKGDPRNWIDSNIALTLTDEWIESMIAGDVQKHELFAEVLRTRMISGSPYLIFIDNVNNQNPECYTERGLSVKTSNLCSEIFLHTDENHSFVCVLSSLNLSRYDEYKNWKSPVSGRTVPQIGIHFLEAVVSEFIRKAKDKVGMGRAVRFAEKSRALGLGVMGLHSLYQLHGLPVKSQEARALNIETSRWIKEEAVKASKELAERFGEPEWCKGTGMRHTHLIAIAPTKTNSVICGAGTEGIEPRDRNYYVAKQAKGTYVRKNLYLEKIFCERGIGPEVWDEILEAKGSVQSLDCLTEQEKEVFKTAREVDQFELIKQASDRQPYVCQGQSLNLFPDPKSDAAYITRLHLAGWKMKLKSLYYCKTSSLLTNKEVVPALIVTREGCPWCVKLKEELAAEGTRYKEITKTEAEEEGFWNPDWKTVPQLWLYKKHIGGYTDYIQYKEETSASKSNFPTETTPDYKECAACES